MEVTFASDMLVHIQACATPPPMDTADLSQHYSRRYNEELERLAARVLAMGGFVEEQLQRAVTALVDGDGALGEAVAMEGDQIDDLEVSIDYECSCLLAIRAPTAGDLRVVLAMMKTITDLERIGDEAEKVGYSAARLAAEERRADTFREVKHLARLVSEMVRDALDAYARMDAQAALAVAHRDRLVDEEYEAIQRQCITFMMEDSRAIRRALDLLWVVRSLERVGDHAKNLCEHVIYMVLGKDARHTPLEVLAPQVFVDEPIRSARTGTLPPPV